MLQVAPLFGRGYIAGFDMKEQRKQYQFQDKLSKKRAADESGDATALLEGEEARRAAAARAARQLVHLEEKVRRFLV